MRRFCTLVVIVLVAGPATAQVTTYEVDALRAQQEAAQRRAIDFDNQLQARDAWRRADEAALTAEIQRGPMRAPELMYAPRDPAPPPALAHYPSIPDAILAQSNARVRDAANNRR